ncbi:hypothetical protein [Salinibacter ruber]|uniref:hypothetical protein n=1 Tax=Salinibacter ruber TaxID=146919 RepID=UPI0013C2E845|nr:hypothetical protein [Salinibacter ruber]
MEALLGLIGLGVISWFVYALFNPEQAVYWHENPSRMKAFGYLLLGMFVIGSLNPNAGDSEAGDDSSTDAQSESTVSEEASDCQPKAGVYVGSYTGRTPSGPERGDAGLIFGDDCSYKLFMDGSEILTGKASAKSSESFELENGNTVYISNGTAKMEESGSNYQATYEMSKLPSED